MQHRAFVCVGCCTCVQQPHRVSPRHVWSFHTTRFLSQGRSRIGYCDGQIITPINPRPPLIRGVKLPTHGKAMCDYQKKIGHQSQRRYLVFCSILALDGCSLSNVDPPYRDIVHPLNAHYSVSVPFIVPKLNVSVST